MTTLLFEYRKAIEAGKFQLAAEIEKRFIEKAQEYSWFRRDFWIAQITLAGLK